MFHLTWKSKSRTSTDNDAWLLKWYFNFVNSRGVSFHQFDLPGVPQSHACARLLERDAMWLYTWGEQWVLTPDGGEVVARGTVVVIDGEYDFAAPPPWLTLDWWRQLVVLPTPLDANRGSLSRSGAPRPDPLARRQPRLP